MKLLLSFALPVSAEVLGPPHVAEQTVAAPVEQLAAAVPKYE